MDSHATTCSSALLCGRSKDWASEHEKLKGTRTFQVHYYVKSYKNAVEGGGGGYEPASVNALEMSAMSKDLPKGEEAMKVVL